MRKLNNEIAFLNHDKGKTVSCRLSGHIFETFTPVEEAPEGYIADSFSVTPRKVLNTANRKQI